MDLLIPRKSITTVLFATSLVAAMQAQVVINEVCPRNSTVIHDYDGESSDWIELYNAGTDCVNLAGWSLSDDPDEPGQWIFPEITLMPDSFLIIFASGKDRKAIVHHWETAIKAEDTWKYWIPDGNPEAGWNGPGYQDSTWLEGPGGYGRGDDDDSTILPDSVATIYIRRVFTIPDTSVISFVLLHMDYDDAFVAYLNGVEIARANIGWPGRTEAWTNISYDVHRAKMYQGLPPEEFRIDMDLFRDIVNEGENVLALQGLNAYANHGNSSLIPFLSFGINGETSMFPAPPDWFGNKTICLHAGFKLSASGECVCLFSPDQAPADIFDFPYLQADHSYGRKHDGQPEKAFYGKPTPGHTNEDSTPLIGYTKSPLFSQEAGFYSMATILDFVNFLPGDTLRYTLDGSAVTDTSALYTGPIFVDSTRVIRAKYFRTGYLPGRESANTYIIGYESNLPVMSLSMNPHDLWDWNEGIYVLGPNASPTFPHFGANFWMDWEKPIHIEYFDTTLAQGFEVDADVVIHGGFSRAQPMKSLRIITNGKYDPAAINYPLFADKPISSFRKFILRNAGQDYNVTHFRDALMHDLVKTDTEIDYQAYQPLVVFLNGEYWGIHNMREKIDRFYVNENFGVPEDEVELLRDNIKIVEGNYYHYVQMLDYIQHVPVITDEVVDSISKLVDLRNYTDYFIAEIYYVNPDWPNHNTKYWRQSNNTSPWRYIITDADFGMGLFSSCTNNELNRVLHGNIQWADNHRILRRLVENSRYRGYFINRSADMMNTMLEPGRIIARIHEFKDRLASEMPIHLERWGGSVSNWEANINNLIWFASNRRQYEWQHYISEFNLVKTIIVGIEVDSIHHGHIRINTIQPEILPWQGTYFDGNPIELEALPDSGYLFSHWAPNSVISGPDTLMPLIQLNVDTNSVFKAYFKKQAIQIIPPKVIITEINYRSNDTLDAADWIELWNTGTETYQLEGWIFQDGNDGHAFSIPALTILEPDSFLVLSQDTAKFRQIFPGVNNITGPFEFGLDSDGEELRLSDSTGNQFLSITYDDEPPWPVNIAGTGKTIILLDPEGDWNDGSNWFAGCPGGSPGAPHTPCDTTAIHEIWIDSFVINVFPNPASGEITISLANLECPTVSIHLVTHTGQEIFAEESPVSASSVNQITIRQGRIPPGFYTLIVRGSDFVSVRKLIVR